MNRFAREETRDGSVPKGGARPPDASTDKALEPGSLPRPSWWQWIPYWTAACWKRAGCRPGGCLEPYLAVIELIKFFGSVGAVVCVFDWLSEKQARFGAARACPRLVCGCAACVS